jgi:hypothetical protein
MVSYDDFGQSSSGNYGTEASFQGNYQLNRLFVHNLKAPFTARDRILISAGPIFSAQMTDFDALLTSEGLPHTLLTQTNNAHNWSSGWLRDAVAGLFGLEKNLNSVASTSPARRFLPKKCPASL